MNLWPHFLAGLRHYSNQNLKAEHRKCETEEGKCYLGNTRDQCAKCILSDARGFGRHGFAEQRSLD